MIQLGMLVMIDLISKVLVGKEKYSDITKCEGKEITSIHIDEEYNDGDGGVVLTFADSSVLTVFDNGRSCCENRYVHTDEDLSNVKGEKLKGIGLGVWEDKGTSCGCEEKQFLIISTDKDTYTFCCYNEHSGCYSGFSIKTTLEEKND